eukprot:CAMPEP_0115002590 /NCGR_PEP_ID=MMETSP0216-20121206/18093_1 /TAXON_ID=223996 /ORGANISM="Protocruzia adherens, Strain Boccale" /LENGTH=615 /DNA_ID=CAMNT_0002368207 /DNA_START=29 /DNA_END=1875 /DNA_ORIENTATION=+
MPNRHSVAASASRTSPQKSRYSTGYSTIYQLKQKAGQSSTPVYLKTVQNPYNTSHSPTLDAVSSRMSVTKGKLGHDTQTFKQTTIKSEAKLRNRYHEKLISSEGNRSRARTGTGHAESGGSFRDLSTEGDEKESELEMIRKDEIVKNSVRALDLLRKSHQGDGMTINYGSSSVMLSDVPASMKRSPRADTLSPRAENSGHSSFKVRTGHLSQTTQNLVDISPTFSKNLRDLSKANKRKQPSPRKAFADRGPLSVTRTTTVSALNRRTSPRKKSPNPHSGAMTSLSTSNPSLSNKRPKTRSPVKVAHSTTTTRKPVTITDISPLRSTTATTKNPQNTLIRPKTKRKSLTEEVTASMTSLKQDHHLVDVTLESSESEYWELQDQEQPQNVSEGIQYLRKCFVGYIFDVTLLNIAVFLAINFDYWTDNMSMWWLYGSIVIHCISFALLNLQNVRSGMALGLRVVIRVVTMTNIAFGVFWLFAVHVGWRYGQMTVLGYDFLLPAWQMYGAVGIILVYLFFWTLEEFSFFRLLLVLLLWMVISVVDCLANQQEAFDTWLVYAGYIAGYYFYLIVIAALLHARKLHAVKYRDATLESLYLHYDALLLLGFGYGIYALSRVY